ncbi:MAG TPA: hypothetical protein VKJ65_11295, partial [Phycisphaerae bacterium]|nr:hypothetical protein [Phycisphaerae bacterium]
MHATKAPMNSTQLLSEARQVVRSEAAGLTQVADRLDESIVRAMELIFQRTGPELPGAVVVSGIGKSGLAGQRV